MKRRAQAAMEFLMTYGWAMLVVLIVIGALAYFGVLDPGIILPPKCNFGVGISCVDYHLKESNVQFLLENGMGKDINIAQIRMNETSAIPIHVCSNTSVGIMLPNGGANTFVLSCDAGEQVTPGKRKYKYDVEIVYNFTGSTAFSHTLRGEVFSSVEG